MPDGSWGLVALRNDRQINVYLTGSTTRPIHVALKAGDEILSVSFKASSYSPSVSAQALLDNALHLIAPTRSHTDTDLGVGVQLALVILLRTPLALLDRARSWIGRTLSSPISEQTLYLRERFALCCVDITIEADYRIGDHVVALRLSSFAQ